MKNILVLGAGRSSSWLIKYLLEQSEGLNSQITICDKSIELAKSKSQNHPFAKSISVDIENSEVLFDLVASHDLIISLLPPSMHLVVAQACLHHCKSLITASYVSPEIQSLHEEALKKNISIVMEAGLDPGIDHMSAMSELDNIKNQGGKITSFKSFTGGLVAAESDTNPWHYKISWNPRNVVLAGQGTVKYLENGTLKYIPYHKLFERIETIHVNGHGAFEAYANRDSLSYMSKYQLEDVSTFLRGTLRSPDFCKAWQLLILLGMTDDSYVIPNVAELTYKDFLKAFLPLSNLPIEEAVCQYLHIEPNSKAFHQLDFLGLFSDERFTISSGTPAQLLQEIIEKKLKLEAGDKDRIVMQHQIEYINAAGVAKKLTSSMVCIGEDATYTAMAKTVGLPIGIIAKLILNNTFTERGVVIPTKSSIYMPTLAELVGYGVEFYTEEEYI